MRISVVTTCFNAAATLKDCLESVKEQTHPEVEHIVVDAASTDGTTSILEENRSDLARVVSEPDEGIYDGMNKGLRLATGEVVGILNSDDVYASAETLAKVARVFEESGVDSCYGDLVYIADEVSRFEVRGSGEKKSHQSLMGQGTESHGFKVVRYWKSGEFDPKKFYWGWMVPHPTFFVRRSVYEKYGYFNPELGMAADYELMLRFLLNHRISCAYIPEILVMMKSGGASNASLGTRLEANRMDRKAWIVNDLRPRPWTLWLKPMRKIGQFVMRPKP